jgi:hypothetical protein
MQKKVKYVKYVPKFVVTWNWITTPAVPILKQISPVLTLPSYFVRIRVTPRLHLAISSGLFPYSVPNKDLYSFLFCPTRATCPSHLTIAVIFCGEDTLWRSWLRNCLQPAVTSYISNSRILFDITSESATRLHMMSRLYIQVLSTFSTFRRVCENGTKRNCDVIQLLWRGRLLNISALI